MEDQKAGLPSLTRSKIEAIKRDHQGKQMTLDQIAKKYKTNRTTVFNYVHGLSKRFKKEGK